MADFSMNNLLNILLELWFGIGPIHVGGQYGMVFN